MIKLYELFAEKNFHTSIATTFGIDFDAYETIVLPRLRGSGCRNNIVFADGRMLTHALSGGSALPRQAGRLYNVEGVVGRGVFHPKLFLQLGRNGGRLIVGSANLTSSGVAGNLELIDVLSCGQDDSPEQRIIAQAWEYLSRLFASGKQGLGVQRDWALSRTPWLRKATAATGSEALSDTTLAAFFAADGEIGIGRRFADKIDGPVSRLVVVSPYWDANLEALSHLRDRLLPKQTAILLDPEAASFPREALGDVPNVTVYGREDFKKGRFIHAKVVIAQTEDADHVLLGSANCTLAALGSGSFSGVNEEASLYRRLPPGSAIEALDLSTALGKSRILDPDDLPPQKLDDEIQMAQLSLQMPGQFECSVDVLTWRPPSASTVDPASIELLTSDGELLECKLVMLSSENGRFRFEITGEPVRPSFATVVFADGRKSAPAIVTLIDELRAVTRETRSRKAESALQDLDIETEASLKLLEIIDFIERLEESELSGELGKDGVSRPGKSQQPKKEMTYTKLDYQTFIAGRRQRTADGPTHNSLSGSELSNVRGLLNRIVGLGDGVKAEVDEDENTIQSSFDLGDETGDGGDAAPRAKPSKSAEEDVAAKLNRRRLAYAKATKEQIVAAVAAYGERVRERVRRRSLDNHDILRLRALLMVVCTSAWPGSEKKSGHHDRRSALQVLPLESDLNSWPMVMGRLLFAIFGGTDPAIRQLYLNNEHDQIPADITECWATAYWCIQACLGAKVSPQEQARIAKFITPLANVAYRMCLPSKNELSGDEVVGVLSGMNKQYASSTGSDPAGINQGHAKTVAKIFG